VTVTLAHPAAIDPFTGLVAARTVETWRASRQDGRWRVAADPLSVRGRRERLTSGPLPTRAAHPRRPGRAVGVLAAVVAVTVLAGLLGGRFLVAGRGDGVGGSRAAGPAVAAGGAAAEVARLQAEVRRRPGQPRLLTRLGVASLARARETADPAWYAKAAGVLGQASKLALADPETMVARGLLDLARHDFRPALAWGTRAARANPDLPDALGVVFDAEVELGHYQAAVATAQAMVDRKPAQGSLARVSYARELLGDPAGAVAAMVQAAAAGGSPADQAYVQTLLGNLHLGAGRLARPRTPTGGPSAGCPALGWPRSAWPGSRPPAGTWPARPGSLSRWPPACPCPPPWPCSATSGPPSATPRRPPASTGWCG